MSYVGAGLVSTRIETMLIIQQGQTQGLPLQHTITYLPTDCFLLHYEPVHLLHGYKSLW